MAGNCNLSIKEEDLKETLELMSERLGHFTGGQKISAPIMVTY